MFKGRFYLFSSIWILLVLVCIYFFQISHDKDRQEYYELLAGGNEVDQQTDYKGKQQRFNVAKHLILTKGPQKRMQVYLRSARSDLMLDQIGGKTEVIECFQDIKCALQESILDNSQGESQASQVIRQIEAEKATYHYKTEDLLANQVKFTRYIAAGHQLNSFCLPGKMLMSGTASGLQLSLSSGEKPFKAQDFQASFLEGKDIP